MKVYNSLDEMRQDNAPARVLEQVENLVYNTSVDPRVPADSSKDFTAYYGGTMNVVETVDDLRSIDTLEEDPNNSSRWLSVYEGHSSFDQAFILVGQEWAVLWMATNNNGGTTYFIPMKVVDVCPDDNVRKCIIDTHGGIAYEEWKRDTPKTP